MAITESGFTCGEGLLACLTSSSQNVKETKSCDKPLLFRQDRNRMVGMFAAFLQLFYSLVSANHMLSLQKIFFVPTEDLRVPFASSNSSNSAKQTKIRKKGNIWTYIFLTKQGIHTDTASGFHQRRTIVFIWGKTLILNVGF